MHIDPNQEPYAAAHAASEIDDEEAQLTTPSRWLWRLCVALACCVAVVALLALSPLLPSRG